MKARKGRRRDGRTARPAGHVVVALLVVLQQTAFPAVITVDGSCNLVDAITAANTETAVNLCSAGSGPDEIQLTSDVTLTAVNNTTNGDNGLPSVFTEITVQGNGFGIERGGGSPSFRIFHVFPAGNLTLKNTTISNGEASSGGGIYNNDGTLTLINSTVSGNTASSGGGIKNRSGTLTLTRSTISENTVSSRGGGISNDGTATLNSSIVSGNDSLGSAGGILNAGTLTLDNSTVSGNSATNFGGGIQNSGGTVILTNTTLLGNMASDAGGLHSWGPATLNNSTVSGNTATSTGGGIHTAASLTLTNSTVSGNASPIGGGIYNYIGATALTNSTLAGNRASSAGGGIHLHFGVPATATFTNSLLANITGGNCSGPEQPTDGGNNFATDTTCGAAIPATLTVADLDPLLKDNGGPTMTHALLASSNAIDAAGACALPGDQRGAGRVGDCDSGAFEFIGCNDLVLANDTITTSVMWETCHTARLGPNLWVEGGLVLVAGAQVILENGVHFGPDALVTLGIDPNLQISSPESLELQGRTSASAVGPPPR